jgi:hypothetical protein
MVFVTTITYTGPSGSNTMEINESPTREQAIEWKYYRITSYYKKIVGIDDDHYYVLPETLNDIMSSLNVKSEDEINYKVEIIKFVIEMKNKYMEKNTSFTISDSEIKK